MSAHNYGDYDNRTNVYPSFAGSRLSRMQAEFQKKQREDKEQKLLQMLDSQQQRAIQKAAQVNGELPLPRYINGHGHIVGQVSPWASQTNTLNFNSPANMNSNLVGNGKVRQMFEERRKVGGNVKPVAQNNNLYSSPRTQPVKASQPYRNGLTPAPGIDRSFPLEPIAKTTTRITSSSKSDPTPHALTPSPTIKSQQMRRPIPSPSPTAAPKSRITSSQERLRPSVNGVSSANSQQLRRSPVSPTHHTAPSTTKYRDVYGVNRTSPAKKDDLNSTYTMQSVESGVRKMNLTSPSSGGKTFRSTQNSPGSLQSSNSSSASLSRSSPAPAKSTSQYRTPSSNTKLGSSAKSAGKTPIPRSSAPPPGTEECKICSRYFASERLEKHMSICKKVSNKKRKIFDPTKMRVSGTEAESYLRKSATKPSFNSRAGAESPGAKKGDWRKKHEEFIKTIRLAKEFQQHIAKGGKASDLPPPPPSDYSDYIQCPHCKRKFSEGAAERHIPKCKDIKSNKR